MNNGMNLRKDKGLNSTDNTCKISKLKNQAPNKSQMESSNKKYDLEERTAKFAERVRDFCLKLPKNAANHEYVP